MTFTFAGLFFGAVSFSCLTLVRALDKPAYPLTAALLHLLPPGVRAFHFSQPTAVRLRRISRLGRGICYVPTQGKRYFIDLNGSFDNYLRKFNRKSRYNLRRTIRQFTDISGDSVKWREFRSASDMTEFHRLAVEVSRQSYQHRMLREGIDTSLTFRDEIVEMAVEDRVRGYILFHLGRPIAYLLCRARATDLAVEKAGFDSSVAAYAPGTVLYYFMIARLMSADRFRRLDFGPGEYSYKAHLATGSIDVAEVYFFPYSIRNAALIALHTGISGVGDLLRSTLEFLGVAQRLKTMVRHGIFKSRKAHLPTSIAEDEIQR